VGTDAGSITRMLPSEKPVLTRLGQEVSDSVVKNS